MIGVPNFYNIKENIIYITVFVFFLYCINIILIINFLKIVFCIICLLKVTELCYKQSKNCFVLIKLSCMCSKNIKTCMNTVFIRLVHANSFLLY